MIPVARLFSNLGYCSRSYAKIWLRKNVVSLKSDPKKQILLHRTKINPEDILLNGEKLPFLPPVSIIVNKPKGYVCTTKRETNTAKIVYDLLPLRLTQLSPPLSFAGRLDIDVNGLLILSQDGKLIQRIITPNKSIGTMPKVYEVVTTHPLTGKEKAVFASGELQLKNEKTPLKPALLEITDPITKRHSRVTLYEGRYHQIIRMFAAVGNRVETIQRVQIGPITLPSALEEGSWQFLTEEQYENLYTKYKW